ncbi:MAG: hypothetical protein V3V08_18695 [Nannocystaceae bacterium]
MSRYGIIGLGVHLPASVRTNDWWPEALVEDFSRKANRPFYAPDMDAAPHTRAHVIQREEMAKIQGDPFQGASERRIADECMPTSEMETLAVTNALRNAGIKPRQVDLVISYACPTDEYLPGNAPAVQYQSGCGPGMAFSVDSACASFGAALMVAESVMRLQALEYAVVGISCKFSVLVDQRDPISLIVGDCAAGVVIGRTGPSLGFLGHLQAAQGSLKAAAVCGTRSLSPWY